MDIEERIRILDGETVRNLLNGKEQEIVEVVKNAYVAYSRGEYSLPHSVFLKFENNPASRIIGLPAFLGGSFDVAGVKWVSSFPENIKYGIDRASATLVLNDTKNGRPIAFMEASTINACRTAASAALAAKYLHTHDNIPKTVGLIGCGYIGFETFRYLKALFPSVIQLRLLDLDDVRADYFKRRVQSQYEDLEVRKVSTVNELSSSDLVVFTTTAGTPWVDEANIFKADTTVLNISLRDLAPKVILAGQNYSDDIDHVCRANTSPHLTEMEIGNRGFMLAGLPDILAEKVKYTRDKKYPVIFSPFGLGILDIAVGKWLLDQAVAQNIGAAFDNFFPSPWGGEY